MHRINVAILVSYFVAAFNLAIEVRSDVVQLTTGGRISGKIVPSSDPQRSVLSIELPGEGKVVVQRRQVDHTTNLTSEEEEYLRRAPTVPDTVESQWALACWCRDRKLTDAFKVHLRRVVELDPDNEEARSLLGYQKHGDQWLTRDELMAVRGMLRHDGDYRTRQEIELMERAKRSKASLADWREKLQRYRRHLVQGPPQRASQAVEAFQSLRDPSSGGPLAKMLLEERNRKVKRLLIETAARIEHPATVQALANLSLEDPDYEVRQDCLDLLLRAERPGITEVYVRALKSRSNEKVNRAAVALGKLNDTGAVSPLIDALVTEHQSTPQGDTNSHQFSMNSSGGFKFGGGASKPVTREIRNPEVLSSLVDITKENFGYDKKQWRGWLATVARQADFDLRRDR